MANQTATLLGDYVDARGQVIEQTSIRLTLVDTDATATTFPDLGGAAVMSLPHSFRIADCIGDGTTAPGTAKTFQFRVNGNDKVDRLNGANVFNPDATPAGRVGSALGKVIPGGSNLQITGRA